MIYKVSEIFAIEPILTMIENKKDVFKISLDVVKNYMMKGIDDELSIILVDEKDKEINGFVFASAEDFNGELVCFIHSCIISPGMKYTCHDFISRLRKWSSEKNIKNMFMSTNKHADGFERKYGFKYHSTLMSLPVDKEARK